MAGINIKIGTISTKFHYPYEGIFGKASPGPEYIVKEVTGNGYVNLTNAVANHLMELKAYGGTEQRNLPIGYTQVESLANTSGAYITTSISLDDNDEIEFWWNAEASGSIFAFSQGASADNKAFQLANTSDNGVVFDIQNYNPYRVITNVQAYNNGIKHIVIKNRKIFIDGVSYGTSTGSVTSPTDTLRLFISSAGATSLSKFTNRFTVKNKINLIPCKRDSDNVLGMYDTVTGSFLTNAGTGSFTAGPDVVPTPTEPMDIVSNNGALKFSKNMANVNAQTIQLGYYISAQGVVTADANNRIYKDFIPVKPNTTYTLSLSSSVYFVSISEYLTTEDSGFIVRKTGSTGSNTQLTITTGATTNYVRFGTNIDRTEITLEEVLAINWQLEIGATPTQYHEYVEGGIYTDGTTEMINAHGKNLFDKNSYTEINTYVNANTGVLTQGSPGANTQYCAVIPCKPNTTYTISGRANSAWGAFTSSNIGTTATSYNKIVDGSITTGANDIYLIGLVRANSDTVYYRDTLQIEQGSTATEYEPYFDGGTATAEMLLKVGDYTDEQEILTGNITRKVGIKVFDGTETFTVSSSGAMITAIPDVKIGAENTPMNTHFALETSPTSIAVGKQRFGASGTQIYSTNYYMKHTTITTAADFKAWLSSQYTAGTPVIVIYPLATPTTESVAGQTMNIPAGNSLIEITQASIDNLGLYAKYKATA